MVNTSGNIGLVALNEAINYIRELAGESVNLIWGNVTGDVFDEEKIVVTIIATGMPEEKEDKRKGVITEVTLMPPKFEIPKVSQPKATEQEKDIDVPPFLSEFAKKYGEATR